MKHNLLSTVLMALTMTMTACSDPGNKSASARMPSQAAAMQAAASPPVVPGVPADWAKFPATCGFRAGNAQCTCVLVGPRTLLTAAHCPQPTNPEKTIGKGRIRVFGHSGQRNVDCEIRADLDLAICTTSPVNVVFETLNNAPLPPNSQLLVTGFGSNGTPSSAGLLRKGLTNITSLPGAGGHLIGIGGGAHLLEGDSGGPAFLLLSPGNENGPRVVAGINENRFDVTSVSTTSALSFIRFNKDGTSRAAQICGINTPAGTQGCRSLS